MPNPFDYCLKTNSEFSHQASLFMWANMAVRFGVRAADDIKSYEVKGYAANIALDQTDIIPELNYLFAIHNQGHGDAIRGGKAKAEGVKAGAPDVCLPVVRPWPPEGRQGGLQEGPGRVQASGGLEACVGISGGLGFYAALYMELKRPKVSGSAKGVASNDQLRWIEFLKLQGCRVEVCYGWLEAKEVILDYVYSR